MFLHKKTYLPFVVIFYYIPVRTLKLILKNKIFRVTILLVILLLPFTSGYRFVVVTGHSMHPTYEDKEWVVEEKASSLGESWGPSRGSVVVVVTKSKEKLIKRVIGLEGEYIEIKNGKVYVNNKKFKDSYTYQDITYWLEPEEVRITKPKSEWLFLNTSLDVGVVPKGFIWVMGDNRIMSWYGLVRVKDIEGKVLY